MKNKQWESIQSAFEIMEKLCGQVEAAGHDSEESSAETRAVDNSPALVNVRKNIRTHLDFLRSQLLEELHERDSYFVLFPIVALFDELVQVQFLDVNQAAWPPLQKELFQVDDAGDMFYETLDEILSKPQTLPIVYEVYYFCLNYGFKGRYNDNELKINEYMKKLKTKIAATAPDDLAAAEPEKPGRFKQIGSKTWYYLAAACVVGVSYFIFSFIADTSGDKFGETRNLQAPGNYDERLIYYKTPAPPSLGRED